MGVGELLTSLFSIAVGHPLIAVGLLLVFGCFLLLGGVHVVRVFGKCFLVLVRELKHEVAGAGEVGREVKKELTKWKADP